MALPTQLSRNILIKNQCLSYDSKFFNLFQNSSWFYATFEHSYHVRTSECIFNKRVRQLNFSNAFVLCTLEFVHIIVDIFSVCVTTSSEHTFVSTQHHVSAVSTQSVDKHKNLHITSISWILTPDEQTILMPFQFSFFPLHQFPLIGEEPPSSITLFGRSYTMPDQDFPSVIGEWTITLSKHDAEVPLVCTW